MWLLPRARQPRMTDAAAALLLWLQLILDGVDVTFRNPLLIADDTCERYTQRTVFSLQQVRALVHAPEQAAPALR